ECEAPLEEGDCVAELAPDEVRAAKKVRCESLDRAIAAGSCDGECLLSETDCRVKVASNDARYRHEGGNPPEPALVAKRPREHLRLFDMISRAHPLCRHSERVAEIEVDIDGQLGRLPGTGQTAESPERGLEVGSGLAIGAPRHRSEPGLAEIGDGLLPHLSAQGVMGQPLSPLGDAFSRKPLNCLGDAGM